MDKADIVRTPFLKKFLLLLICGAVGAFVSVAILAVFAAVIVGTGSFSALAGIAVYAAAAAGGFVSGLMAAKNLKGRGIVIGIAASVICIAILSLVALITGAEGGGIIPAALCLAGGIAGGIIGVNMAKK
jgi:putative membrane protein (TIGR04086 family)